MLSYVGDICTDDVNSTVTDANSTLIDSIAAHSASSRCILHSFMLMAIYKQNIFLPKAVLSTHNYYLILIWGTNVKKISRRNARYKEGTPVAPRLRWLTWGKVMWLGYKLNYLRFQIIFTWKNYWERRVIQMWLFGKHFLKNEQNSMSLQGKQQMLFVANYRICVFKWKLEFWKTDILHH